MKNNLITDRIKRKVRDEVRLRGTEIPFIIFLTFLLTFSIVRLYVWTFQVHEREYLQTELFGFRVHHYWWGILLISLAGWMAIVHKGKTFDRTASIMYGVGLGLLIDEVGLLLTNDYFSMSTYSMVVILILLFLSSDLLRLFPVCLLLHICLQMSPSSPRATHRAGRVQ